MVLESFEGSIITFRGSGELYPMQVNILCEILHRLIYDDSWSKALTLCRRTQVIQPDYKQEYARISVLNDFEYFTMCRF